VSRRDPARPAAAVTDTGTATASTGSIANSGIMGNVTLTPPPTVDLRVTVEGGLTFPGTPGIVAGPIAYIAAVAALNRDKQPATWVGVTVANTGTADVEITGVGWTVEAAGGAPLGHWWFDPFPGRSNLLPYRLLSHEGGAWFRPVDELDAVIVEGLRRRRVPERVRGVAVTGSGLTFTGPWVPAVDLPIWASAEAYARLQAIARGEAASP